MAKGKNKPVYISRFLNSVSVFVWCCSLINVPLQLIVRVHGLFWFSVAIILATASQGFFCGAYRKNNSFSLHPTPPKALDRCIDVSQTFSLVCCFLCFLILLGADGSPYVMDGKYYLVNHGEVVQTIPKALYYCIAVCGKAFFSCLILFISSSMTKRIRCLYLSQLDNSTHN